jgi:hypothetical protein
MISQPRHLKRVVKRANSMNPAVVVADIVVAVAVIAVAEADIVAVDDDVAAVAVVDIAAAADKPIVLAILMIFRDLFDSFFGSNRSFSLTESSTIRK